MDALSRKKELVGLELGFAEHELRRRARVLGAQHKDLEDAIAEADWSRVLRKMIDLQSEAANMVDTLMECCVHSELLKTLEKLDDASGKKGLS